MKLVVVLDATVWSTDPDRLTETHISYSGQYNSRSQIRSSNPTNGFKPFFMASSQEEEIVQRMTLPYRRTRRINLQLGD